MTFEKQKKPSGWKGAQTDSMWTRDRKYGREYMCSFCGKSARGIDAASYNHIKGCPVPIQNSQNRITSRNARIDLLKRDLESLEYANELESIFIAGWTAEEKPDEG